MTNIGCCPREHNNGRPISYLLLCKQDVTHTATWWVNAMPKRCNCNLVKFRFPKKLKLSTTVCNVYLCPGPLDLSIQTLTHGKLASRLRSEKSSPLNVWASAQTHYIGYGSTAPTYYSQPEHSPRCVPIRPQKGGRDFWSGYLVERLGVIRQEDKDYSLNAWFTYRRMYNFWWTEWP